MNQIDYDPEKFDADAYGNLIPKEKEDEEEEQYTDHWFVVDEQYFAKINQEFDQYQGWSNSATWCFNLLFLQEQANYNALKNLIRKDGTINPDRAIRLFNHAGIRLQISEWCEGNINVPEILEEFEAGFRAG